MTFDDHYFSTHYGDYERQNPPRKLEWYLDLVAPDPASQHVRYLDIGCGLGTMLARAHLRGWEIHGSDISDYAVQRARMVCPAGDIRTVDAYSLPWRAASFDVVTMLDVVEHVPDVTRALHTAEQALTPTGEVLIVVPVYDGITGPVIRRLDKDPTHLHKWGRYQWLDAIGRHFAVREWLGVFRILPPMGPYVHIPTKRLRRHAPAIAVVAGPKPDHRKSPDLSAADRSAGDASGGS